MSTFAHKHAPDHALVSAFDACLPAETQDANEFCSMKCTENKSIRVTQKVRVPLGRSMLILFESRTKRLWRVAQGFQSKFAQLVCIGFLQPTNNHVARRSFHAPHPMTKARPCNHHNHHTFAALGKTVEITYIRLSAWTLVGKNWLASRS